MIGDIERIKRVGENSMKAKTLGGKKKPKRIVQPQRIGATHVPRNVSNYDGMVENLPTMEPPIVGATSQLERMQEDNRLQRLEMKVSSMGNDISTMSRDISTMSRDMAMLATLLAPGAKAGGREYRETVQPPPRASTSGALQSSNIGGQANVKLSPAGHDQPSSAAAFPQEAAEQQPKVAEASQGSLVFGWPWASSPVS